MRDGKKQKSEKKAKINLSTLIFFPTICLVTLKVYTKFEDFGSHKSREICDKIFIGEKEKWTYKGNDKQEEADSLLHIKKKLYRTFVPNFKILGSVVPEKYLTKKKFSPPPPPTHTVTETTKFIYSLYT